MAVNRTVTLAATKLATAPRGRDSSLGKDERSAQGNMWGPDIHDAFGAGGLGLSGIGEGGGGRGRLPPEVIQRIVRQNYGRFRMCYEQGLQQNPNLEGRVGVRFVIGRDGAVSNASNAGSDLPDSNVVQCVVRAYYGLSFPAPEGGIVTVSYPIMFSPG